MGYPQIIQVMGDHDLVLKPMVTWGSPILGHLHMFGNWSWKLKSGTWSRGKCGNVKSAVTEGLHRLSAEGPCPRMGEGFYRITSKNRQHEGDVTSPKVYLEIEDKDYEFL